MIPFGDNIPSVRSPVLTVTLIAVNVAVFLFQTSLSEVDEERFIYRFGVIPIEFSDQVLGQGPKHVLVPSERLVRRGPWRVFQVEHEIRRFRLEGTFLGAAVPLLTSMFLHGGWMHLISNMWFLWLFGDNVEDRLGRPRYLALYLVSGVLAGASQVLVNWGAVIPMIGASGAVAGLLGAYFITYPYARVRTLVPFFYFFWPIVELPAVVFLGLWFVMQFLNGAAALGSGSGAGVAWWAHVGGFVAGIILMKLIAPPPPQRRGPSWIELSDEAD